MFKPNYWFFVNPVAYVYRFVCLFCKCFIIYWTCHVAVKCAKFSTKRTLSSHSLPKYSAIVFSLSHKTALDIFLCLVGFALLDHTELCCKLSVKRPQTKMRLFYSHKQIIQIFTNRNIQRFFFFTWDKLEISASLKVKSLSPSSKARPELWVQAN